MPRQPPAHRDLANPATRARAAASSWRAACCLVLSGLASCGRIGYGELASEPSDASASPADGSLDDGSSPGDAPASPGSDAALDGTCPSCRPTSVTLSGQMITDSHGGTTSGTGYDDLCGGDEVVIGYNGTLSENPNFTWLQSIQTMCGRLGIAGTSPYEVSILPSASLAERGSVGDVIWSRMCPNNQVVMGFDGRSSGYADQLAFRCAPLVITGGAGNYDISIGMVTTLMSLGSNGGTAFPTTDCPSGSVARGSSLRADQWVRAFALTCGTPSLALQ